MTTTDAALAALRAELDKALADIKASHAPVIYVAGLTEGLRTAIRIIEKHRED